MTSRAAKLTIHEVQQMRHDYASGRFTQGALARRHGVSVFQVGRIIRHECWQHVEELALEPFDLEQSARRLLAIQEQVNEQKATAKMQDSIRADVESGKTGDKLLDELTGDQDARSKPTTNS